MSKPVLNVAFKWWEFRRRYHCPHYFLRGIYGDEIFFTPGHRRLQCRRCGRYLDGPVEMATTRPQATTRST